MNTAFPALTVENNVIFTSDKDNYVKSAMLLPKDFLLYFY